MCREEIEQDRPSLRKEDGKVTQDIVNRFRVDSKESQRAEFKYGMQIEKQNFGTI